MNSRLLGTWGEEKATEYLKKKGYKILDVGYSCRFGEIDIIAHKRKMLVFVEVKLRKSNKFANACEFVTISKQKRIAITAQMWISENTVELQPRFDVIEVYAPNGILNKCPKINHIENAFEVQI